MMGGFSDRERRALRRAAEILRERPEPEPLLRYFSGPDGEKVPSEDVLTHGAEWSTACAEGALAIGLMEAGEDAPRGLLSLARDLGGRLGVVPWIMEKQGPEAVAVLYEEAAVS